MLGFGVLTAPAPPPTTLPEMLDHPAGRFLTDPWGTLAALAGTLLDVLTLGAQRYGLFVVAVGLLAALVRVGLGRWRQARRHEHAQWVEILLPPEVNPDSAAAFWRHLGGLLHQPPALVGRPYVAWEYRWHGERLTIGLWLPSSLSPRLIAQAVQTAWPGAHTRTHNPPLPPLPTTTPEQPGMVTGGTLRLARPEWWSLRTEHDTDPIRPLLGAAERRGQETIVVQVLARPAPPARLARVRRVAGALRRGQSPTSQGRLLDLLLPGPATRPSAYTMDPDRSREVRAILDKAAPPGWETLIRYGVATHGYDRREQGRRRAHGINAALGGVFTDRNQFTRRRLWRPHRALVAREFHRGDLLSLPEIAALAHLPWDYGVPGVDRAGARSVAPAASVARSGKVLGDADTGPPRPIALSPVDARQHLHVIGATGSGKSTLLAHLILQDAQAGRGVAVIDPRGDLVRDVLDRAPASLAGRLVLLDPEERTAPPALNILEGDDPEVATEHLLAILRGVFSTAWGPRTDDVVRAACLSLLRVGPATLRDIPRVLTEPAFRHRRLATLREPAELLGFWDWYEQLTPATQAQLIGPALSRLRGFLLRGFASEVIDATTSSVDIANVLDGGILLARLPKGTLGEDASHLLGAMVVSKVWRAALSRAQAGESTRLDASLVVDEAQHFLHLPDSYEQILAEARGYGLGLTLAHQHLAQLPKDLREALSSNARNKVMFSLSPEDARALVGHVTPALSEHDLANLGGYQAAARLVRDGVELPACTLTTRELPQVVPGRAEQLRQAARRRYGRTAAQRRRQALRRDFAHHNDEQEGETPPEAPEAGTSEQ